MIYKTEQEAFWAGDFGDDYNNRNKGDALLSANLNSFSKLLRGTRNIKTAIEFGANIGINLRALKLLFPTINLHGIEINAEAVQELSKVIPKNHIYKSSILDWAPTQTWDLCLIKTVLIHINTDELNLVYDKLVTATGRYLLVAEYYNPVPTSIQYRGHIDRLFKRDFAGEIMDRHPNMKLLDYGFTYHRDPKFSTG
jgi:pseudaminic acid biosynthesis-associated methylase